MLKLSTAPAEYDETPSPLANVGGGASGNTPAFRVEPTAAHSEGKAAAVRVLGLDKTAGFNWADLPDIVNAGHQMLPALGHSIANTVAPVAGMIGKGVAGMGGLTLALHGGANAAFKGLRRLHLPGLHRDPLPVSPKDTWFNRLKTRVADKLPELPRFRDPTPRPSAANPITKSSLPIMGRIADKIGLPSLPVGHEYETQSMAMGMRNAMQGNRMNPGLRTTMTRGLGPESAVMSDLGEMMGQSMQGLPRGRQIRLAKKARKALAMSPTLQETPLGRPMVGAINHLLAGDTPLERGLRTVGLGPTGKDAPLTAAQKWTPRALGAAAVAADPHAALHFGINQARVNTAESEMGQKFMWDQLRDGYKGTAPINMQAAREAVKTPAGAADFANRLVTDPQHEAQKQMWDFAVSPAALDTRRLGEAARQSEALGEPGARAIRSLLNNAAANPANAAKLQALAQRPDVQAKLREAAKDPNIQARINAALSDPNTQAQINGAISTNPLQGQLAGLVNHPAGQGNFSLAGPINLPWHLAK